MKQNKNIKTNYIKYKQLSGKQMYIPQLYSLE